LARGPRAALALAVAQRLGQKSPFLCYFLLAKQKKVGQHGQEINFHIADNISFSFTIITRLTNELLLLPHQTYSWNYLNIFLLII